MLYPLLRTLLFLLAATSPLSADEAVTRRLGDRPGLARLLRTVTATTRAAVRVAGLHFPNRVGLAGGMDKDAVAPLAWWAFGFGFAELGTVTPRPQPGNPRPRMFREPAARAVVNRMGFNNAGAESLAARLRALPARPPYPLGVSVGKNATTPLDRAADDYAAAAVVVAPVADFLSVNVSSPNTAGLRALQTGAAVRDLVRAVRGVALGKPVFVKVAPELTGDPLAGVVEAALGEGAAGLIATNTWGTPRGGRSGRPLREVALRRVEEVRRLTGDGVAVIGCGGIDAVGPARRMVAAGADLVQVYTGLVYEGPFLAARLARGLRGQSPQVPGEDQ